MAANVRTTAFQVATIASQLLLSTASVVKEVATLTKEFPWVGPAIKTLNAIQEMADATERNKEQLARLCERCAYIMAGVVIKCQRTPNRMDVQPLMKHLDDVETLMKRCGHQGKMKNFRDRDKIKSDIAKLYGKMGDLIGDMGLTGIVMLDTKVEELQRSQGRCHTELMAKINEQTDQLVGYVVLSMCIG